MAVFLLFHHFKSHSQVGEERVGKGQGWEGEVGGRVKGWKGDYFNGIPPTSHKCLRCGARRARAVRAISTECEFMRRLQAGWIPFGDHPLKLERCREDQHGPCARMTRTHGEV